MRDVHSASSGAADAEVEINRKPERAEDVGHHLIVVVKKS